MKKLLVLGLCAALLVFAAPMASAQYISFAIDDCLVAGGAQTANPTCAGTSYIDQLIATFQLASPQTQFVAAEIVVDMQDDGNAGDMSPWWQWDGTGCRTGAPVVGGQPEAFGLATWSFTCEDVALLATSGITIGGAIKRPSPSPSLGPNSQRIQSQWIVPSSNAIALAAATQYAPGYLRILSTGANGHPAATCAGCTSPVTMTLNSIAALQVAGAPGGSVTLATPLPFPAAGGTNFTNCITFNQSWTSSCPTGATPTEARTWGQLKSLYR